MTLVGLKGGSRTGRWMNLVPMIRADEFYIGTLKLRHDYVPFKNPKEPWIMMAISRPQVRGDLIQAL